MYAFYALFGFFWLYSNVFALETYLPDILNQIECSHILGKSDDLWASRVVEPAAKIIRSFLNENGSSMAYLEAPNRTSQKLIQRDLWTQYTCKVSNMWDTFWDIIPVCSSLAIFFSSIFLLVFKSATSSDVVAFFFHW
jgi:hypothetical protein